MSMQHEARRGRALLKPPEVKPWVTLAIMFFSAWLNTGKGDIKWMLDHAMSAEKVMNGIHSNNWVALSILSLISGTGHITLWIMLFNVLFIWLFGSLVEKKLIVWRYPVFIVLSLIVPMLMLGLTIPAGSAAYSQMIVGPSLMTCFLLGGFFMFMPKKPFKPQEWKTPKWKVFKGNDGEQRTMLKVPWVSPYVYVVGFALWTGLQQLLLTISRQDVINATKQLWAGQVYTALTGSSFSGGTVLVVQPLVAVLSVVAGYVSAYVLINVATTVRYKRSASDLQVQAVLQYKELRSLDMNHLQAVEGTSKLIGVPVDICRDWINKGLQPIKED